MTLYDDDSLLQPSASGYAGMLHKFALFNKLNPEENIPTEYFTDEKFASFFHQLGVDSKYSMSQYKKAGAALNFLNDRRGISNTSQSECYPKLQLVKDKWSEQWRKFPHFPKKAESQ